MKRKAISFLLSVALIGSFSLNVKAVEMNNSAEIISETLVEDEEQSQEDTSSLNSNEEEVTGNEGTNETPIEIPIETPPETPTEAEEEVSPSVEEIIENSDRSYDSKFLTGDQFTLESVSEEYLRETDTLVHIGSDLEDGSLDESHIGEHLIAITYEDVDKVSHTDEILIEVTGKPLILLENEVISDGQVFELEPLIIKASDHEDGNLSEHVVLKESEIPLGEAVSAESLASFSILLSVTDSDGNEATEEFMISVEENLVSSQEISANAITADKTITLSGENRYKTATAISQAMYQTTDVVILVSASNFPDALSAGPLAKSMNAPILLTGADRLSGSTAEEIKRLGATRVIIMGGESAVSKAVEETLKESQLSVERIAGSSRYTTAIAAAEKLGASTKIILANGNDFADAMTAGSYASMNQYPIILTRTDQLNSSVRDFINSGIQEVIIMGGESAISGTIESELVKSGVKVTRIAGSNRFNTSVAMAEFAYSTVKTAVVSNGMNFVDALTAVPYAASMGLPVLLISKDRINAGVKEYLLDYGISNFHFIGGESAITQSVKNSMMYPSLYDVSYRSMDLKGNWSETFKNGEATGNLEGSGLTHFEIETAKEKDIAIRYGVSVSGLGWQQITDSGATGVTGRTINGLIMELKGTDAAAFDISYRAYIKSSGWTSWVSGGTPVGGLSDAPVLAIETKIIKGNALDISKKIAPTYAVVRTDLNMRAGEGTSFQLLTVIPNESRIKVISVNGNWAHIRYTDSDDKVYLGYVHTGYIETTNAIISMSGIENGDSIPTDTLHVSGDIAYKEGIKEVNYYINNTFIGRVDYGYLSNSSLEFEFDSPMQTGYQISIPQEAWLPDQINVLKVEFIGMDNRKEFESRYLQPVSDGSETYVYDNNTKSFHTYLAIENAKTNPGPQVWSPNGWVKATMEQTTEAMDPSGYITHETYKYIFLDLSYKAGDYGITVEQLEAVLKDKGVLDGMGHVFLKAAVDFKVNPFYLIAHALHETGNGNSRLALGQQLDFYHEKFGDANSTLIALSDEDRVKKWHNVYGIGAYDRDPILWGKEKAYRERWDTVERAIYGGAKYIADGYIDRTPFAQNTLYKMRYDLRGNMTHQYATDIMWAQNQSKTIKKQFDNMGIDISLRFIIPAFGEIRK